MAQPAQPIVGNCYTMTMVGVTKYIGRCIGITHADSKRHGLFNMRLIAYFSLNDDKSKNICDYGETELISMFQEDFGNLTPAECQKLPSSTGGNSSSSSVVPPPRPLTGGRSRARKTRKSKKARKSRKGKKQSRRRV